MPVLFRCPHCSHETWVTEEIVGESGPCTNCNMTVTVEATPHQQDAAPPTPTDADRTTTVRRFKNRVPTRQLVRSAAWLAAGLVSLTLITLIGWLIFRQLAPPVLMAGPAAVKQAERETNFQRLAVALRDYHQDQGHFPPTHTADEQGSPLHSWRVLLLPYLGHQQLYRRFNLEEPWDSPENLQLVNEMPDVYGCPFDPDNASGETSYLAITGSRLAFNGTQHRGLLDITDAPANTVLLIETCDTGIVWTRPKDLDGQQLIWSVHAPQGGIGCEADDGTLMVVTADGRAHRLTSAIPPERLRALATIDGGESESLDGWVVE